MALIELKTNPTARDLKWFGLILLAFFGVVGGIVWLRSGSLAIPRIIWGAGVVLAAIYYAIPPARKPMFVGWSYLTYPIGFVVSHVLLAVLFFGVFTTVGLVMRLFGYDPMRKTFDRSATTYWVRHEESADVSRYFRQD